MSDETIEPGTPLIDIFPDGISISFGPHGLEVQNENLAPLPPQSPSPLTRWIEELEVMKREALQQYRHHSNWFLMGCGTPTKPDEDPE